ncbi:MAG: lactate utilization protein, partial [Spirochaetaceae bacterium]|nr:lactate utilization protein [Spirochaetaceae bacterium]
GGNRVAALIYGPRQVIVVAGMNKVVKTLDDAIRRTRTVASPKNQQRFPSHKTPCTVNGSCGDCVSPDCICSYLTITRMSNPAGRIKVILINEELGL